VPAENVIKADVVTFNLSTIRNYILADGYLTFTVDKVTVSSKYLYVLLFSDIYEAIYSF